MARRKDVNWNIPEGTPTTNEAMLAVMMDLRDELKKLNTLLHCWRFIEIPSTLKRIDRRMAKNMPIRKTVLRGGKK